MYCHYGDLSVSRLRSYIIRRCIIGTYFLATLYPIVEIVIPFDSTFVRLFKFWCCLPNVEIESCFFGLWSDRNSFKYKQGFSLQLDVQFFLSALCLFRHFPLNDSVFVSRGRGVKRWSVRSYCIRISFSNQKSVISFCYFLVLF